MSAGHKVIDTGYRPRELQAKLHRELRRFSVLVMHRRFGKTVFAINHMIDRGLRNELKSPQYAYIAPLYGQAKRVAWNYLKQYTSAIPGAQPNEAELRVDIPRPDRGDFVRFVLLGADNPAALKGIYLDGAVLDEYADMNPVVWGEVIRPTLADRHGWAIFIGTPKGQNAFYELYQRSLYGFEQEDGSRVPDSEWFGALYKASETKIVADKELESAKKEMTEEEYEQEFECSFLAALSGAYYAKEMAAAEKGGRITSVPCDPALPVYTFWDLGIGDTTAIWFIQQLRHEVHVIDYYETNGASLQHYVKVLREKDYVYDTHYLPHDAAARELGTGKTRQEQLKSLGLGRTKILPKQNIDDGIQAVRTLLPKVWFDRAKTERGVKCLMNYQRAWDGKNQIFKQTPLHNWASNGADAFRYAALGLKPDIGEVNRSLPRQAEMEWDIFTH